MKRHESIVTLSREHHFGLLFCWKIRQGIKKQVPAGRMQAYVQYFWNTHLQRHFGQEEKLLFAALHDDLCDQAVSEHQRIGKIVEAVNNARPDLPRQLILLVNEIDHHIRFEERVLFPHLEAALPEAQLLEIGARLKLLHEGHPKDTYPDEFWV